MEWERGTADFDLEMKVGPHPGLKGGNRRTVELDLGMTDRPIGAGVALLRRCQRERRNP